MSDSVDVRVIHPHPLRRQFKRGQKGWRKSPNGVMVCRPWRWGNPFRVVTTNQESVDRFVSWLELGDQSEFWSEDTRQKWEWMRANLSTLAGRELYCYCPLDEPCHADVLASYAESLEK